MVFSATFAAKENTKGASGGEVMCMRLMYNGVRRAHRSSRLGFLPATALTRGIALNSISNGEGYVDFREPCSQIVSV